MTMAISDTSNKAPFDVGSNNNETLAVRMRAAIMSNGHKTTYHRPIMQSLVSGDVTNEKYAQHLVNTEAFMKELEDGIEYNKNLPYIQPLGMPEILRTEAIKEDMKLFKDIKTESLHEVAEYVNHIKYISQNTPHLLVAHAYSHYLGYIFGGSTFYKSLQPKFGENHTKLYQFYDLKKK